MTNDHPGSNDKNKVVRPKIGEGGATPTKFVLRPVLGSSPFIGLWSLRRTSVHLVDLHGRLALFIGYRGRLGIGDSHPPYLTLSGTADKAGKLN